MVWRCWPSLAERLPRLKAKLFQRHGGRTEAGEGRLYHVEPGKGGKQHPPGAHKVGQGDAGQHDEASEDKDCAIKSHLDQSSVGWGLRRSEGLGHPGGDLVGGHHAGPTGHLAPVLEQDERGNP